MFNLFRVIGPQVLSVLALLGPVATAQVSVSLSTPHNSYLIAEPVVLDISVRNDGTRIARGYRPPPDYLEIYISEKGKPHSIIDQTGLTKTLLWKAATLEPSRPWLYQLRAMHNIRRSTDGSVLLDLAFPKPGIYLVDVRVPIQATFADGAKLDGYYRSNLIEVHIDASNEEDVDVQLAIRGSEFGRFLRTGQLLSLDKSTLMDAAHLLEIHPASGYRDALRWSLNEYYRHDLQPRRASDPQREAIRRVLGLPDDRVAPDDPRLDAPVVLEYLQPTLLRRVFDDLRRQVDVPLDASPQFDLPNRGMTCDRKEQSLRDALTEMIVTGSAAWVRRGAGYYVYAETFGGPDVRRYYRETLGPPPPAFPDDLRLAARVDARFEQPTAIPEVLASYTKQSGIPLTAAPFFGRCRQSGVNPGLVLREEMGYLARTFRAQWHRRGDGYHLDAGAEADRVEPPPAKAALVPGWTPELAPLGVLTVLGIVGFTLWRRSQPRVGPKLRPWAVHQSRLAPPKTTARP